MTPDWNLISELLAVASSPLTLLILTLTQIVQTQVIARSSGRAEAEHHDELMGALGAIGRGQTTEVGVSRTIVERLTAILDWLQHGFATPALDVPGPDPADLLASGSVVESNPPPQPLQLDRTGRALPTSQELGVARQQARDLSAYLDNHPANDATIIGATVLEQELKKAQESGLADAYKRLTPQEQAAIRHAIPDWSVLQTTLREAIAENAILVLPTALGASQQGASAFIRALRDTVDVYNGSCEASSAARPPAPGMGRPRQAQRLHLAANILSPHLAWTNENVAAVQRLLHMMPSICLQVDLRQPDGVAHLLAWYWATGNQQPNAFSQWLKPVAAPIRPQDAAFVTAEMLVVLLADLLSLSASEGVSVLSAVLTQQGVSERLRQRFNDWYRTMREAFAPNYGGDVVGVPAVVDAAPLPEEVVDGPPSITLAKLRGCVWPSRFSASIKGYTNGVLLYLAMQDNDATWSHVYYLAIEPRDDSCLVIRAWRESLGSTPLTMSDVDQRLNTCAERCADIYSRTPERFVVIADAPLDTLKYTLGGQLHKLADGADAHS